MTPPQPTADEGTAASEMSPRAYRSITKSKERRRFQNRLASAMTVLTVVLMVGLSVLFGKNGDEEINGLGPMARANTNANEFLDYRSSSSMIQVPTNMLSSTTSDEWSHPPEGNRAWRRRWLDDNDGGDADDNDDGDVDYSKFSCHSMYDQTPMPGKEQCRFARACNRGRGIFASWAFCSKKYSIFTIFCIISPFLLLWMILLFRMLGSTAEDFFSPSLEMFSGKLGLPPRFAGVSLLALGNGAADVSATMSAIISDSENGYKLAMGELTGAAMLVGGVISGVVVLVSGGVPCRGALIRDAMALIITVLAVWGTFVKGEITTSSITIFLSLYVLFVCLVLAADVYHRAVVLPRLALVADDSELQRQASAERQINETAGTTSDVAISSGESTPSSDGLISPAQVQAQGRAGGTRVRPSPISRVITAISNYDNPTQDGNGGIVPTNSGWGVDSDQLEQDQPIVLHGRDGILSGDHHHHHPSHNSHDNSEDRPGGLQPSGQPDESGAYELVDDSMGQMCSARNTESFSASNWSGAWKDCKQELQGHAVEVWEDIYYDADVPILERFLLTCELPFTFLRKISVPIPCEGYYNRAIVALSVAFSPLWFAYYISHGHHLNMFSSECLVFFLSFWGIAIIVAILLVRFAPGGDGQMSLSIATPLALYGFCIAATWIDFVADNLVSLLNFIGIIMRIPATIMGLTILAWGNSMGDLSANLTMARKGLANMAMTACFAGPVFNILMGLGLGFSSSAASTGNAVKEVSLSPTVVVGFIFILLNSIVIIFTGLVLGNGRIKPYYGYIALALYTVYVSIAVGLQFTKHGENH